MKFRPAPNRFAGARIRLPNRPSALTIAGMSTAIILSDIYKLHDTGDHPECVERYLTIIDRLAAEQDLRDSLIRIEPREATLEELQRCHGERVMGRVGQAVMQAAVYSQVSLDADTVLSADSDRAAKMAAGGACRAVDAVATGEAGSVFVACRPPGHHATFHQSMGFCLYNNVAVAARHAQATYPDIIKRVLIVDFDVHHGNGTQDIFYDDPTVFYYSLHQYPWYPGTGGADERGTREGEGFNLNIPVRAATPADAYIRMFERGLDSIMSTFSPDLVIVSAGFDAHLTDPLGQLLLTDPDYRRMTSLLKQAALTTAGGRLISCLEGGYNLETLGDTVLSHLSALE